MLKTNKKRLSAIVSVMFLAGIHSTKASDIEIYKDATRGNTSILLMLDTSGSMGISSLVLPKNNAYGSSGDVDSALCSRVNVTETGSGTPIKEWSYNAIDNRSSSPTRNKTAFYKQVVINGQTIPYYLRGCGTPSINATGDLVESEAGKFDRLSKLKDAIITLLASSSIDDSIYMGLGHFSSRTPLLIGDTQNKLVDGHSGKILVPLAQLSSAQREALIRQIASIQSVDTTTNQDGTASNNLKLSSTSYPDIFKASSGTPTAHAYAEAGAYMMGTTTGQNVNETSRTKLIYDGYSVMQKSDDSSKQVYYSCVSLDGGTTTTAFGATVKTCNNAWNLRSDNTWYDSTNKKAGTNVTIYKPNGSGGWTSVTADQLKAEVGAMNSNWEVHEKLPEGWRYGGWMKLKNEPMDIEPINGTVWNNYGALNLVSYRSSPFSTEVNSSNEPIDNNYGGFAYSVNTSKNGSNYIRGAKTGDCDGNGIYFLTDGAPNSTKDNMAQTIMNTSLTSGYTINQKPSGLTSPAITSTLFTGETGGWEYIGEYAKKLNSTNNLLRKAIKTAVVGFGSSFSSLAGTSGSVDSNRCNDVENADAKNACLWGSSNYGNGGIYYAEDASDIKNSIIDFVKKTAVVFDPITTGSPVIPVDKLSPTVVQKYGYYASLTPTPQESYRLWEGNLNKYQIINGVLKGSNNAQLITDTGILNNNATGYWTGGAKQQIPLQADGRKVLTNRNPLIQSDTTSLLQVTTNSLLDTSGSFKQDPKKGYWLNVLGYNVDPTKTSFTSSDLVGTSVLRQFGSVMHSTPLLLTQQGTITTTDTGSVTTTNRDDYLLFGTTQGILHVVKAGDETSTGTYNGGKEVFAFIPNEMMNNQTTAFQDKSNTSGDLFYGIDGPWTAYTQYKSQADGTLSTSVDTVSATDTDTDISSKSLQWVYGGLRMGGRGYYSLDLSNINLPALKFHIDPDNQAVWSATKGKLTYPQLQFMGQSWSKPTIAWVKYGGTKRLVMFVGGGYDTAYETPNYEQTNGKGGAVYMFDANTGELLWWVNNDKTKGTYRAYNESNEQLSVKTAYKQAMKYSVVSQINAVDRDGDGLVDNLYFGDLGGQVFRIDLDNANESTQVNYVNKGHIVRLLNHHVTTGLSPRFYEIPSIAIHSNETGKFATVSITSGNRSTPLTTDTALDAVDVIYDNDVARTDLYTISVSETDQSALRTKDVSLQAFNNTTGIPQSSDSAYNGGWYYNFSTTPGAYKAMNGAYAIGNLLYVNTFYKDGVGTGSTSTTCGAGVRGDSYVFRFCLPTGKCNVSGDTSPDATKTKIGAGLLGASLSTQAVEGKTFITTTAGNNANPTTSLNGTPLSTGLKQLRWYDLSQ